MNRYISHLKKQGIRKEFQQISITAPQPHVNWSVKFTTEFPANFQIHLTPDSSSQLLKHNNAFNWEQMFTLHKIKIQKDNH